MNNLEWLENFYKQQCNGDWEHTYGLKIETLDNPGWFLKIDLAETYLEDREFSSVQIERTESDWFHCHIKDKSFVIACGSKNLTEGIEIFRKWVEGEMHAETT